MIRAAERGGAGGQIAPGPEVLGAPEKFLLGPSLFCVLNIYAQRTTYLFFWAKYRNLEWKIEIKGGGGGLSEKNFSGKKF